ncbi:MAG: hypothetical protein KDJ99_26445 [Candidatus Competibacteraceae bacterium]|nr:hypothetical protein [Candidatus Competibacteraceae bacterium]
MLDKLSLRNSRLGLKHGIQKTGSLTLRDGKPAKIEPKNGTALDLSRLEALKLRRRSTPDQQSTPLATPTSSEGEQQQLASVFISLDEAAKRADELSNRYQTQRTPCGNQPQYLCKIRHLRENIKRYEATLTGRNWLRRNLGSWDTRKALNAARKELNEQSGTINAALVATLEDVHRLEVEIKKARPEQEYQQLLAQLQHLKRKLFEDLIALKLPGLDENNARFQQFLNQTTEGFNPLWAKFEQLLENLIRLDCNLDEEHFRPLLDSLLNHLASHGYTRDFAATRPEDALDSMNILIDGLLDGTLADYLLGGDDRFDELRLALKLRAESGDEPALIRARHELQLAQRQLAHSLHIDSGLEHKRTRVFLGDTMAGVKMDAAFMQGLRTAPRMTADDKFAKRPGSKPQSSSLHEDNALDIRSNLLMAKVRLLQDEVERLNPNTMTQDESSNPTLIKGRDKLGSLADYGIDRQSSRLLLADDDDVDFYKPLEPKMKARLLTCIDELIKRRFISVESAQGASRIVGDMQGTLTRNTSRMAGNVITTVQTEWSPEVQSNAYLTQALQHITGATENFALSVGDQQVDEAFKTVLSPLEQGNDEVYAALELLAEEIALLERELLQRVTQWGKQPEEQAQLEALIARREDMLEQHKKELDRLYGSDNIDLAIRTAVLAARPKGVPLDHYNPVDKLDEIENILRGWGLNPALVRPELDHVVTATLDRAQLAQWRGELDHLTALHISADLAEDDANSEQQAARDLGRKEALQLTASVKEFTPGSYLYVSSSSFIANKFAAKIDPKIVGLTAAQKTQHQQTVELKVSAGSNGYDVTLYAGPGLSLSAEAKAKLAGLFHIDGSGGFSKKDFGGFTFNFRNGDDQTALARLQTFIQMVCSDEAFGMDDLIMLTDDVSVFTQDQHSAGTGGGGKVGADEELTLGAASIEANAGARLGVDYSWFKKDKYNYTADAVSHNVLVMYKLTENVNVSAQAAMGNFLPDSLEPELVLKTDAVSGQASHPHGSIGVGGGGGIIKTGVVYGWTGDTRAKDTGTYQSADCGFSAWDGHWNPLAKNNSWQTLRQLANVAGYREEFERWRDDPRPEYQQFRASFNALLAQRSGADFVKVYMGIKPAKLSEANELIAAARRLENPATVTDERRKEAAKLRKQAQAIIDDRVNYRPAGVGFAPTEEWSGSTSATLIKAGVDINVAGGTEELSIGNSTWGELSLVRKIAVPSAS